MKHRGGMIGLSRSDNTLDRLVTTTPHLARIVKQYLSTLDRTTLDAGKSYEHYQLTGDVALRTTENALKLRQAIKCIV